MPGLFNSCRKTPALQLGKLYDDVSLRLTEKDKNDWILVLDLLIQAVPNAGRRRRPTAT